MFEFPIKIIFGKSNGKWVNRKECHEAHEKLEKFLDNKFADTNKRIDDFILSVNNYINLLKNGK